MTLQEKIEMLADIMDVDEETISVETNLSDVEEWDSLSSLSLTVEMKRKFNLTLSTTVLKSFKTVGDICDFIPDTM